VMAGRFSINLEKNQYNSSEPYRYLKFSLKNFKN